MKIIKTPRPGIALEGLMEIEPVFDAVKEGGRTDFGDALPMPLINGFKKMSENVARSLSDPVAQEHGIDYANTGFIVLMNQDQAGIALQALHRLVIERTDKPLEAQGYGELAASIQKHLEGEGEELDRPGLVRAAHRTVLFDLVDFQPATGAFGIEVA